MLSYHQRQPETDAKEALPMSKDKGKDKGMVKKKKKEKKKTPQAGS